MSGIKAGTQSIGCRVTSCRYNHDGCDCSLSKIEIEPMSGGHTGQPCDESLCANYVSRN